MELQPASRSLGLGLAAGIVALVVLASPAGATFPGRNGLIAFSVQRDKGYELFLVRPDGSKLVRLTRNAVDDGQPAWSPDGKRIAFTRRFGNLEIYVMRADGTGVRRLTRRGGDDRMPAWSPNGRRIAFYRSSLGLAVMNADGSGVRILVPRGVYFGEQDGSPSWSPDGKQIAFIRDTGSGTSGLWVVRANGSGLRRLTASDKDETDPDWAPDGSRIVFVRHNPCGGSCDVPSLVTIRPDGTNERTVSGFGELQQPSWSPDGKLLVALGAQGLTILPPSGAVLRAIGLKGDVFDPAWQPLGG